MANSTTKTLRAQSSSIRKDRTGARRTSFNSPMLASLPSDHSVSGLTERRRRMSSRASRDVRNGSLSQRSPSYVSAMAAANGESDSAENLEDAPRTKTGRISTAKKGKPVHKCEDCGKVYTRNEHLKRHQLNHSTKSIPCDIPRCKKKFHRIDLLHRHKKEEHNLDPITGMPIEGSPVLGGQSEDLSYTGDSASDMDPRRTSSTSMYPSSAVMSGIWDEHSVSPSPKMSMGPPYAQEFTYMEPYNPSYGIHPEANFFALPDSTTADTFGTTGYDYSGSRSPVSATSSAQIWSQYNGDSRRPSRNPFSPISTESLSPFNTPFTGMAASEFVDNSTNYYEAQDKCEETIITKELGNIIRPQDNYGFQPHLANLDPRYLNAYWQNFDPLYSVVNRLTFETSGTSPLVKALMVTIGAYHFSDQMAQTLALTLRETCSKLLHERLVLDYTHSRLWDLQAIFLFEALSLYCSRRPHSRFSQRFEDLLLGLHGDQDNAHYNTPLSVIDVNSPNFYGAMESAQRVQWVHLESKRRLLLACFTLEVQQNLFFGSHRPVSDRNLPMSCSSGLWNTKTFEEWSFLAQQEVADTRTLSDVMAASYAGERSITDSFMSNVAIAHASQSGPFDPIGSTQIALQCGIQTPQSMFAVEAASLAINTPISHLLAVSGETFVLGQKLATSDQYHEAFTELQTWISSDIALSAQQSAVRLFGMALQQERIGLIYEDWVMTLASLVFWACAMWPQQGKIQSRLSALPAHGIVELTTKAIATETEQPEQAWREGRAMSWGSARACLAFVRQRIDGRIGWLNQDACGVLNKLVDGRVVDDISSSENAA